MCKYEMDPTRTVGATERTWDAGRTDGRKPIYPPTIHCGEGIMTSYVELNRPERAGQQIEQWYSQIEQILHTKEQLCGNGSAKNASSPCIMGYLWPVSCIGAAWDGHVWISAMLLNCVPCMCPYTGHAIKEHQSFQVGIWVRWWRWACLVTWFAIIW